MKKLLIALTTLCMGFSYAQEQKSIFIEEGNWGLGGRLSIVSNKIEYKSDNFDSSSEGSNFYAMPKIGYAIKDNWLLGLNLIYNYHNHQGYNEVITQSIGLAPGIQKYFPVVENFAFSLEGSLEYLYRWSKSSSLPNPGKSIHNSYSVAIRPGFSYLLGKQFALEANTGILSFTRVENSIDGIQEREDNVFQLSMDLSNIQFGAIYFFN